LTEIDIILDHQSLGVIESAVKAEMENPAAGNGPSGRRCRGTAGSLLPQQLRQPKGSLQFQLLEEPAYQGKARARRVINNKYLLPSHLSPQTPLIHGVGNK